MKLLIADDEQLIRQGVRLMLEGSRMPFDDILEADSGRTAVALAQQYNPEIILMDIKMPGLDGIAAARQICGFNSDCKIIFLTAYDQFEYAREAVRCRAVDFLVKPVSREDLINTIQACSEEISRLIGRKHREEHIKKELSCSVEEFLVNELVTGTTLSPLQLWSKLLIISPPADQPWFAEDKLPNTCLVFSSDCRLPEAKAKKTIGLSVKGYSFPLLIEQLEKKLICLTFIPGAGTGTRDAAIALAGELAGTLCKQNEAVVNIGIGRIHSHIGQLCHSYSEACQALEYSLHVASKSGGKKFYVVHIDDISENKVFSRPYQTVQQVISYLDSNYNKKVSLEEVAQMVYLNPTYLSTVIKQETGHNFSDYLTLIRVEKAKKMMNSRLSVKEVAKNVGYPDSNYFCRVFKKVTGDTPTNYRKNKFSLD